MVIDHIANASKYFGLGKCFEDALTFLMNVKDCAEETTILNERVTIKPVSYTTRDEAECVFEAHKKYADIHFILSGRECIGYAPVDRLCVKEVNDEQDFLLFNGNGVKIPLEKGDFMILLPEDAHMVGICNGEPCNCVKLVVKILL